MNLMLATDFRICFLCCLYFFFKEIYNIIIVIILCLPLLSVAIQFKDSLEFNYYFQVQVRGVRQGCPLSGILFTIGVEFLANAIRSTNDIKGIEIDDTNTIKLTQYADDTTVFLRDVRSLNNLFSLLARFENCSGLRINQSKPELLWLGSLRYRKDTLFNLRLSEEPIYALGVHFSYDEQLAAKKNFFDRLDPLRRILNIWSSRDISIYGRINVVKTIAISKLTFVCSVLHTPDKFANEVNKLIFDYVWKHKNPKVKKSTLVKSKKKKKEGLTWLTLLCLIKH